MLNSVPIHFLVAGDFFQCFKTSPLVWQIEWLKDMREGCVPATHTLNGSFKIQKTMFLQHKNISCASDGQDKGFSVLWVGEGKSHTEARKYFTIPDQ